MGKSDRRTATIWVPLAEIQISKRRRRSISRSTVERYRLWLDQGRDPPPVRLARQGSAYVVRDGRHRIAAALAAGHTLVKAELQAIAGWLGRRSARRTSTRPATTQQHLGDEALPAEQLVCSEKERVRLPPSPLTPASVVSTARQSPLYGR